MIFWPMMKLPIALTDVVCNSSVPLCPCVTFDRYLSRCGIIGIARFASVAARKPMEDQHGHKHSTALGCVRPGDRYRAGALRGAGKLGAPAGRRGGPARTH